jgi:WD40 repeat protein/DNA-binding SARP family transcriptional activator/energy-coupling factor transporter ATP-binding protein EcfA2
MGMGIAVLGPLTVDGLTGSLRHHDRVVLTALAVRPGEVVSAERLADALWGEEPPRTWSKVVQGSIVRLRKALGPGVIETTPRGYRLTLPADEIDCRRFEGMVDRGRELLALSEPERAAYVLDEAMALWRGPALADLDGWDEGRIEVVRLEELRRDAEELGLDAALRSGHSREVLTTARTLVAEAPLRERRWALLALAQYQTGQQADALRTLRQIRALLAKELGLDPGPELVALEQAILRQDPALVVETALPEPSSTCPYRGLVPYGVADDDAFFGREDDVTECLRRLVAQGVLAVVGPSGSGKSSLVRAGVAAALQRDGRRVVVVTPGVHPMDALSVLPTRGKLPVLVVDQCEEVFSLCPDSEERQRFLESLSQYAERSLLVVALRADRTGDIAAHPAFARLVERGLFLLGSMSADKLRRCIEGPAKQAGLLVEAGLVDLLVREVEGEPGALPLLSHALRETWANREGRTLTVAGYQASGGIRGAVARSAEEIYEQVPEDQRPVLRELMLRLVTPGVAGEPVRSRMPRRLVADDEPHREVIERLVAARLFTSDDGVLELAHEALVQAWPRFRQWLDDDVEGQRIQRHLTAAADTWDSMGRPQSELYRGIRLAQATDWVKSTHPGLTPVEQELLAASQAMVDAELTQAQRRAREERRARRRTRNLAVALAAALALTLIAAVGAIMFQQAAEDRAVEAADASTEADANRLAALSRSVRSLDLSLLLAAEAIRTADTPATRDGLFSSLVTHRRATQVLQLDQRAADAVIAGGGKTLFLSMPTQITSWRIGSAREPEVVVRWGHKFDFLAGSPTEDLVASWSWKDDETPRIAVFDSAGSERFLVEGFDAIGGWPRGLGFSEDGRSLLASVLSGNDPGYRRTVVREYDLATGRLVRTVPLQRVTDAGSWLTADISTDGSTAVSWVQGESGPGTLTNLESGKRVPLRTSDRPEGTESFLALPGGAAQVWSDGAVTLYDDSGRSQQVLQAHQVPVWDIVVSPTGKWAATADDSGQVIVWGIERGTGVWSPRESPVGHDGRVVALAADPSGETLVTVSHDGTAVTWDMSDLAGFGTPVDGLGDSWVSNRPAVVVPGELLVAPTRPAPGGRRGAWWEQTAVSATFIDPRSGEVVDSVYAGENMGFIFGSSSAVSPDRSQVALTYGYGVLVLDARTRDPLARIELDDIEMFGEQHPEPVWCSTWTPDGSRLLLCADGHEFDPLDGDLVVVDTATWEVEEERVVLGGAAQTLEVSPDGGLIAVGMTIPDVDESPPGTVKLLDAETLETVRELTMSADDFPYDLSFSPDGDRVAVGVATGRLYVFDVTTGRQIHGAARVHHDMVQHVEWLPDGKTVVSTGSDSMVTLYDAERGLVRATMPAASQRGPAHTYLLSWTGETVSAVSGERPGRAYPLAAEKWLEHACEVAGRDLTRDEWSSYLPERPYRRTCSDRA